MVFRARQWAIDPNSDGRQNNGGGGLTGALFGLLGQKKATQNALDLRDTQKQMDLDFYTQQRGVDLGFENQKYSHRTVEDMKKDAHRAGQERTTEKSRRESSKGMLADIIKTVGPEHAKNMKDVSVDPKSGAVKYGNQSQGTVEQIQRPRPLDENGAEIPNKGNKGNKGKTISERFPDPISNTTGKSIGPKNPAADASVKKFGEGVKKLKKLEARDRLTNPSRTSSNLSDAGDNPSDVKSRREKMPTNLPFPDKD
jgi:hypothetical protein